MALMLILSGTTGCLSSLNKRGIALATAIAPVTDQAGSAYRSANAIHIMRSDYDAIAAFDAPAPAPAYNPRIIQPLLSDKDIEIRLAVLAAFQAYADSVVAITTNTDTPQLQAAANAAGERLAHLGNAVAPSIESTLGFAGSSTQTAPTAAQSDPITPTIRNGITTAVDALGQFLINRRIKKELHHTILSMDPQLKLLCDLMQSDIAILQGIEDRDYNSILNRQTLFLRENSGKIDAAERQRLILQLPAIARQQQSSDRQLALLSAAVSRLELAHHELTAEVLNKNPETLWQKLAELKAAGTNLASFYSSLPPS
ncbi:MAG TPA: hypothetical protein VGU46_03955 [Acidobacteriaceae bacterium]|nr:hypothetical protein [Acidobacteriaceae bacterium]